MLTRALVALCLTGCLPDLGGWQVLDPNRDGGPPISDAYIPPVDDCAAPRPLGAEYREGFEAGPGGWGIRNEGDSAPSWHWGTPAQESIATAGVGSHAWMTRLDGNYFDHEDSSLVSPCFDASGTSQDLLIELWRAFELGRGDFVMVEYSVDGVTWMNTHESGQLNWYSSRAGWTNDDGWERSAALLPGTAGQPRVQVRVRLETDYSGTDEGFALDEVVIREARTDLAVELTEETRCGYASGRVVNVGGLPVESGFEVSWDVDGLTDIEAFDRTLRYGEEQTFTIGGELAFRSSASVFTVGDAQSDNDSATLSHDTVALGGGWSTELEIDDGRMRVGGRNPSWEWAEPAGALISTAASGSRAWITNADGEYNSSEDSYVQTVCFDFTSAAVDPTLSFMRAYRMEECCDGVEVEVSVDGSSYRTVGSTSSGGVNWYDSSRHGFTGSSGAGSWTQSSHPLTNTAGHGAVRVRFHLVTDYNTQNEGFAFDDLRITP